MESLIELFLIGGIIGGGANLFVKWFYKDEVAENNIAESMKLREKKSAKKDTDRAKNSAKIPWVHPKTKIVRSNEEKSRETSDDRKSFAIFLESKNLSSMEFETKSRAYKESVYKSWIKQNTNLQNKKIFKENTPEVKTFINLSLLDFFRHNHYNEFETNQGIDLKTSKLEMIEIYKLFKAYLLLNYNIEVNDPNE